MIHTYELYEPRQGKEKQKCSAPLTHRMISNRLPQVSGFYEARIGPSYHKCNTQKFNNEFYRDMQFTTN